MRAENGEGSRVIGVHDDDQADILTFTCTETPEPAVAEEAADAVWVRYDPKSQHNLLGLGFGECLPFHCFLEQGVESLHGEQTRSAGQPDKGHRSFVAVTDAPDYPLSTH